MSKTFDLGDTTGAAKDVIIIGGVALVGFILWRSGTLKVLGSAFSGLTESVGDTADILSGIGSAATSFAHGTVDVVKDLTSGPALFLDYLIDGRPLDYFSGQEATSAYVVIRQRHFNSQWQMSSSAYQAVKGMHSDNEKILKTYVLDGLKLKPSLQKIIKLTDFVVIRPNGEIQSA